MIEIIKALIEQMRNKLEDDTISIEARNLLVRLKKELEDFRDTHDFKDIQHTYEFNDLMDRHKKELNQLNKKENKCSEPTDD